MATDVDVEADGAGTVRAGVGLDDQALASVGDLRKILVVDDLRRAGWAVTSPQRDAEGTTWVRASKGFGDSEGATLVMAELGGLFGGAVLQGRRSVLRASNSFRATVDLSRGLEAFTDADLTATVGPAIGDSEAARALAGQMRVDVSVKLPGRLRASGATLRQGRASWSVEPGQRITLEASADLDRTPVLLAGLASGGAVAVAIGGVLLFRRRKSRSGQNAAAG